MSQKTALFSRLIALVLIPCLMMSDVKALATDPITKTSSSDVSSTFEAEALTLALAGGFFWAHFHNVPVFLHTYHAWINLKTTLPVAIFALGFIKSNGNGAKAFEPEMKPPKLMEATDPSRALQLQSYINAVLDKFWKGEYISGPSVGDLYKKILSSQNGQKSSAHASLSVSSQAPNTPPTLNKPHIPLRIFFEGVLAQQLKPWFPKKFVDIERYADDSKSVRNILDFLAHHYRVPRDIFFTRAGELSDSLEYRLIKSPPKGKKSEHVTGFEDDLRIKENVAGLVVRSTKVDSLRRDSGFVGIGLMAALVPLAAGLFSLHSLMLVGMPWIGMVMIPRAWEKFVNRLNITTEEDEKISLAVALASLQAESLSGTQKDLSKTAKQIVSVLKAIRRDEKNQISPDLERFIGQTLIRAQHHFAGVIWLALMQNKISELPSIIRQEEARQFIPKKDPINPNNGSLLEGGLAVKPPQENTSKSKAAAAGVSGSDLRRAA